MEDAVLSMHGKVSFYHAALIHSAVRHETVALLKERRLRQEDDSLSTVEKGTLEDQISKATDLRDKCLSKLGLDKQDEPAWIFPNESNPKAIETNRVDEETDEPNPFESSPEQESPPTSGEADPS